MKSVLLLGLGKFGKHLAMRLDEMGHEVMAVDNCEEDVNAVQSYVTGSRIGDVTDESFLKTLGVRDYDVCIVAISKDFQSSLEATSLLKELGAQYIAARSSSEVQTKFLKKLGADSVIYPEKMAANWAAICYTSERVFDYMELDEDHGILEVTVPEDWDGKTVAMLDIRKKHNLNIIGLKNENKLNLSITPDTALNRGENLLIAGKIRDINKVFKL